MYILAIQVSLYACINNDKWQSICLFTHIITNTYIEIEYNSGTKNILYVTWKLKLNSHLYVREKIDQLIKNDAINNISSNNKNSEWHIICDNDRIELYKTKMH